ncbi:hypothetical protein SAMN04515672_0496 [Natronorubrum texcoconense]|uniref:Uncharacterized protein n=2 Tax=Natronorubrum texcoconense TaxID=1095776 RepID=A0A1G8TJK3_9EURY|nr:hypothetical protein SAMN04515672_0496 [Natronorubrum texcoconense]
MKKSALVGSTAPFTLSGSVKASAPDCCTDSPHTDEKDGMEWERPAEDEAYRCQSAGYSHRVNLAGNLAFWGTEHLEDEDRYIHRFESFGHSESYSDPLDCEFADWDYNDTTGILKQKAIFINELPVTTSMPTSTGSEVKANPPIGDSTSESAGLDIALAVASGAIGKANWVTGTAFGIVGALATNDVGNDEEDGEIDYTWDYSSGEYCPCATNAVYQQIWSEQDGHDSFSMSHHQEAWGDAGVQDIYIAHSWEAQGNMIVPGSNGTTSNIEMEDDERDEVEHDMKKRSEVTSGEIIRDSEGNDVEVTGVEKNSSFIPEKPSKTIPASESVSSKKTGTVDLLRPSVQVKKTTITGIVKD